MQYSYSTFAIAALFSSTFAAPSSYTTKKDLISGLTSLPVVSTVASDAAPVVAAVAGDVKSELTSLPVIGPLTGGVVNGAATVVGTVGAVVRRQLDVVSGLADGLVGTGESLVAGVGSEVTGLPVVGKLTSSLPLAKKGAGTVSALGSAVGKLSTSVTADISTITTIVTANVLDSVLPTVEYSLLSIASSINATIATIVPVVTGTVTPLAVGEVEALISTLGQVQTIVSDIETLLTSLASSLADDALATIKPEIKALTAVIAPLVAPLTTFAFSVAATVADVDGEGNAILTAAFEVTGVAGSLLSPVTGVLSHL